MGTHDPKEHKRHYRRPISPKARFCFVQYALPTLLKRIDEQYMYCLLINYTSGCQPIRMAVIYIATLAGGE